MSKNWWKDLINALEEIDNKAFGEGDCSLIFFFGTNDNGERYVDAEMVTNHVVYTSRENHQDMGDYIGAKDLNDAIKELSKRL